VACGLGKHPPFAPQPSVDKNPHVSSAAQSLSVVHVATAPSVQAPSWANGLVVYPAGRPLQIVLTTVPSHAHPGA